MMYNNTHIIPESSSFYQGNTEQFFTRKFGKNLSFKVNHIYWDSEEEFNVEKYRAEFSRRINALISDRISKNGGTGFHTIAANSLNIKPVKLAKEDDDICGNFRIDPPTGICTKDGCNKYFVLGDGRKCGHKNTDSWEQFTFLAFCDYCGRTLPLHYMTNIMNKCKECNTEGSMLKLVWPKGGKENIKQYRVRCVKCGHEESLYFFKCNHKNGELAEEFSINDIKRHNFRAVPARANALLHPYVISIPDVSQNDDQSHINLSKTTSEAFVSLFGYDIEEAKLFSPQFRAILQESTEFWSLSRIESIIEDLSDIYNIEMFNIKNIDNNAFSEILKNVLIESHSRSINNTNKDSILKKYGIDYINNALLSIRSIKFYEDDLQGLQLINTHNSFKKEVPDTPPANYDSWLENYGLDKVCHFSNLSMIQALLGIVEGSTRRNPLLFRTIDVGYPNPKPTSYVRTYNTEGILFQLNPMRVLEWLDVNKDQLMISSNILPINEKYIFPHYMDIVMNSDECRSAVMSLIHTYSHMLIQQSSVNTGLDIQSISEIIYPSVASFMIFSTNSINMGGLEYVYQYHLDSWFEMVKDLAQSCPQDPACMIVEGGACNSCSYLPEFVCCNFNNNLDRSTLVGGSERFSEGFFK